MPENNSITDIRYKLILRMIGELELTNTLIAADNPYGLEASVIAEFEAYRTEWHNIAFGSLEGIYIDYNSEMLLGRAGQADKSHEWPALPDGWVVMTRSVGDLPPILVHKSHFDSYDSSMDTSLTPTGVLSGL
tara:strand:- start:233 stop:631 length:399 start_codon:yes stop_codon:yes gene_type:complete